MISLLLTFIVLVLWYGLRYFSYRSKSADEALELKKSNHFSSFVFLCGVVYLILKLNKRMFCTNRMLINTLLSVVGGVVILETMVVVIWVNIEYLILEVLPNLMAKLLDEFNEYSFKTMDLPFVFILWGISISFAMFVHKSDTLLEGFLKLPDKTFKSISSLADCPSGESLEINFGTTSDVDDDHSSVSSASLHITNSHGDCRSRMKVARITNDKVSVYYRNLNTLPLVSSSTRRSLRNRSKSRLSPRLIEV